MLKQDWISILMTFVFGLFAGGYLYVTEFATYVNNSAVPDAVEASKLSIVSDIYGGCGNQCSSFQVLGDGSYRYFYTPNEGGEQVLVEGKLPNDIQKSLKNAFASGQLETQSKPYEPTVCNSYSDGLDVVYEITKNGTEYNLDSCGTAIDGNSELWTALNSIWSYLYTQKK
jgi:hypothetical protein